MHRDAFSLIQKKITPYITFDFGTGGVSPPPFVDLNLNYFLFNPSKPFPKHLDKLRL